MKTRPLIGRRIRIGCRIDVNQPLQLSKSPETSKIVRKRPKKRKGFPLDAQVEMAFMIEMMPTFQHEHLYSPPLTYFK